MPYTCLVAATLRFGFIAQLHPIHFLLDNLFFSPAATQFEKFMKGYHQQYLGEYT
jgi:hypothetical protein